MSTPIAMARDWYRVFVNARTASARIARITELPRPLSSGWRATIRRAAEMAERDGQHDVARRLRERRADPPTMHNGKVGTCTKCADTLPLACFGELRRMARNVRHDPETNGPALRAHWYVESVGPRSASGRYPVVIAVRQAQCLACRAGHEDDDSRSAYWYRKDLGTVEDNSRSMSPCRFQSSGSAP